MLTTTNDVAEEDGREAAGRPSAFAELVRSAQRRLAMPIAVYPGARLIGRSVADLARDGALQAEASEALRARLGLPFALTAMDLSLEAEAFGAQVRFAEDEIPTVIGRRVTDAEGVAGLAVPHVGAGRTSVALEAVRHLRTRGAAPLVIGGCIGPFSLAGRLFGVSEALELTLLEPETAHAIVGLAATFLQAYVAALRDAGAHAVLMAEPTAGLLSPAGLAELSSPYVRRIRETTEVGGFSVILHNCGARLAHLGAILESGAQALHFGAPMDLPAARAQAPEGVILCGNLDPSAVFVGLGPAAVAEATRTLVSTLGQRHNVVFSSGCDIPPSVSVETLAAFCGAVESFPGTCCRIRFAADGFGSVSPTRVGWRAASASSRFSSARLRTMEGPVDAPRGER